VGVARRGEDGYSERQGLCVRPFSRIHRWYAGSSWKQNFSCSGWRSIVDRQLKMLWQHKSPDETGSVCVVFKTVRAFSGLSTRGWSSSVHTSQPEISAVFTEVMVSTWTTADTVPRLSGLLIWDNPECHVGMCERG